MIVVDTSALVAILEIEDDAPLYSQAIEQGGTVLLSAPTYVELGAVMRRKRGQNFLKDMDDFLALAGIEIEPLSTQQAQIALQAYTRYGVLNFGDAFSYALAKDKNIPLLFKGNDFTKTDLKRVV